MPSRQPAGCRRYQCVARSESLGFLIGIMCEGQFLGCFLAPVERESSGRRFDLPEYRNFFGDSGTQFGELARRDHYATLYRSRSFVVGFDGAVETPAKIVHVD